MKAYWILVLGLLLGAQQVLGQSRQAVFLKNGSVINGRVVSTEQQVTVETYDGSIWVFDWSEVEKVGPQRKRSGMQKERGFVSMTSFSVLTGTHQSRWSDSRTVNVAPVLHSFNGYQFNSHFAFGLGLGVQGYPDMAMVPVTLAMRGSLGKGVLAPYYGVELGYAFPWIAEADWEEFGGGAIFNPMVGMKRYGRRGGGIFMQFGWVIQGVTYNNNSDWNNIDRRATYRRMQFGFGVFF